MELCIYRFLSFLGFRNLFPQLKRKYNKEHRKRKHVGDSFIKDTWTRESFCLPLINSSNSPSSDLMNVLTKAGLGKKKLVFSKDDNHQQFVEKINKAYPRPVQCGGFTLQRAATGVYGRPLISLDTQWFHVKLLRREKVSGHGVIYIKTMQQNLSLDPITEKEVCYLNVVCIFLGRVWLRFSGNTPNLPKHSRGK